MKESKRKLQGQMRVIETVFAAFVIIFAISFLNTLAVPPPSGTYDVSDLEKLGYNVLYELDSQGILEEFVYGENWTNLALALRVLLPVNVYFRLDVYDADGNHLNEDYLIAYGDWAAASESKYVASVTYALPGNSTEYNPRIIELKLVRG